jgi:2',3'-cyclic-nucleotide 2'-phosphodiesterase (5'-nucleotidase family)
LLRKTILALFVCVAIITVVLAQEPTAPASGVLAPQPPTLDERLGADDGFALAILITANMRGNLEVCDCNYPRGGLARRLGYLEAFKKKFKDVPVLQVEAGQLWYTSSPSDRVVILQNDQVVRAYTRWPVDVINLSRNDLVEAQHWLVKEGLAERQQRTPMLKSFISANANYDDDTAAPPPFIIKEVSGPRIKGGKLRVGFVGLAEPLRSGGGVADATVKNMYEAARRVVPVVRKQCDVLVIVAHSEMAGAMKLATENPEADVVIAGNAEGLFNTRQVGPTLVVPAAPGNIRQGDLRVYLDKDGHARFKYIFTDLDAVVPSDPEATAFVQAARLERERARYSQ